MAAVRGVVDIIENLRSARGVNIFYVVVAAGAVIAAATSVNVRVDGRMLTVAAKST